MIAVSTDSRIRSTLLALLAVLAVALAAPALAGAQEGGDNAAVAENTEDGAYLFDFAFSLRQVMGDVVDETNTAVAYSSCEDCQTVALAVQVVLVMSDPSVITPENVAVALNEDCSSCATLAMAYQLVIGRGQPVRLTGAGRAGIAALRQDFRELGEDDELTLEEIQGETDELIAELRLLLAEQLVPRGGPPEDAGPPEGTPGPSEDAVPPEDEDVPGATEDGESAAPSEPEDEPLEGDETLEGDTEDEAIEPEDEGVEDDDPTSGGASTGAE